MEVRDIIMGLGFLLIFFYQKHKIGSLETQIKSQRGILESAEVFLKLFDLEKLKDYGEILSEKARAEKEIEFNKIKADIDKKIEKEKNKQEYLQRFLVNEYIACMKALVDFLYHLPSILREIAINDMDEGGLKETMKEVNKHLKERDEIRRIALSEAFSKALIERKNESNDK